MDEQQSIDDPYKGFAKLFKRIAAESGRQPSAIIGKIVSPPPELKVSVNGMVLDKKYFWVDESGCKGIQEPTKAILYQKPSRRRAAAVTLNSPAIRMESTTTTPTRNH